MEDAVIIFFTAIIATALSSMSGGGASAINIPVLLSLGVPFPLATVAQKISSACWTPVAAYNYLKDRKIDWKFLTIFSGVGLVGVYYGTLFIITINQRALEIIVGILIIILATYTLFKNDLGLVEKNIYSKSRQALAYVFAPILGFYEGLFGAGNGIMFPVVTVSTKGFDFVDALGYYYLVSFPWVVFATGLLISKGYFDVGIILPTILGSVIGGYIGSRYAKYKGNRFIKIMFVIIGSLLGLKLLVGF